jgi:hypothetical protein
MNFYEAPKEYMHLRHRFSYFMKYSVNAKAVDVYKGTRRIDWHLQITAL